VAAFSTRGATREGIVEAAREDYAALLGANTHLLDSAFEESQSTRGANAAS
jgi:hypothetical protein